MVTACAGAHLLNRWIGLHLVYAQSGIRFAPDDWAGA